MTQKKKDWSEDIKLSCGFVKKEEKTYSGILCGVDGMAKLEIWKWNEEAGKILRCLHNHPCINIIVRIP